MYCWPTFECFPLFRSGDEVLDDGWIDCNKCVVNVLFTIGHSNNNEIGKMAQLRAMIVITSPEESVSFVPKWFTINWYNWKIKLNVDVIKLIEPSILNCDLNSNRWFKRSKSSRSFPLVNESFKTDPLRWRLPLLVHSMEINFFMAALLVESFALGLSITFIILVVGDCSGTGLVDIVIVKLTFTIPVGHQFNNN